MAKKTTMMKDLEHAFALADLDVDDCLHQTKQLLSSYNRLAWLDCNAALDTIRTHYDLPDLRLGTQLLEDASPLHTMPDTRKMRSIAVMVDIMTQLADQVTQYPVYGAQYGVILRGAYFNKNPQSDMALCDALHLERTTYYSRKREAIALFGYMLFTKYLPQLKMLCQ